MLRSWMFFLHCHPLSLQVRHEQFRCLLGITDRGDER